MLLFHSTHCFLWIKGCSSPQIHPLVQEDSFSTNFALHKINAVTLVSYNLLIVQWKEHICLEKGRWRVMEPLSSATERVFLGNTQLECSQGTGEGKKKKKKMRVFVHNMQQGKFQPDIQNIFLVGVVKHWRLPMNLWNLHPWGDSIQRLIGQTPEKHNQARKLILFELWIGTRWLPKVPPAWIVLWFCDS